MRIKRIAVIVKHKLTLNEKFKRRLVRYSGAFEIEGSRNSNWNPVYLRKKNYPDFQSELKQFKSELVNEIQSNKSLGYLKFGDGDYYFLKGEPTGSAAPGRRAISRELTEVELTRYRENSIKADKFLCEIDIQNRKLFTELFGMKQAIPAEFVYGLTANHWLTKLPYKIGLIGADKKLDLIKKLMQFDQYQEYLGLNEFSDYIKVPQKFACDNLDNRLNELEIQLKGSTADLFLVGVGHLKSGIMSEMTKMKNAVYLDIGSGIDALAGLIDAKRPYFGSWINHRINDQDLYQDLDLLQYDSNRTIYLN